MKCVKKVFEPNCTLCHVILRNRSQFCQNKHFLPGGSKKAKIQFSALICQKKTVQVPFLSENCEWCKDFEWKIIVLCGAIFWNRSQFCHS